MAVSLPCLFQLPVLCPCGSGGARADTPPHTGTCVELSSRPRTVASTSMALLQRVPIWAACVWSQAGVQGMLSGSRSHRRRPGRAAGGMAEPHWLRGLQIFIMGLGSLPLLVGRESGSRGLVGPSDSWLFFSNLII